MNGHHLKLVILLSLALGAIVTPLSTAAEYTFDTLDVPFEKAQGTFATGITDRGQVVGVYVDRQWIMRGFLYRPRQNHFARVEHPDFISLAVHDVNASLEITGFFGDIDGLHGFRTERHGLTPIDMPDATITEAIGNNDAGEIVGDYRDAAGVFHGFLRSAKGILVTLDAPGASSTAARGINNHGHIVGSYDDATGSHGFRYADGVWTTIDVPMPEAISTVLEDINDEGLILGYWFDGEVAYDFIYDGATFHPLVVPDAFLTQASGINNLGQIVGRYIDPQGIEHGFIATPLENHIATTDQNQVTAWVKGTCHADPWKCDRHRGHERLAIGRALRDHLLAGKAHAPAETPRGQLSAQDGR